MRLLALPEAMRDHGVDVVEWAGWQTRGIAFPRNPIGGIDHWTVGAATGELPSSAVLLYGRSDLPGPLCNVARGRRQNRRRARAHMIASGKANHAGAGIWPTTSGRTADSNYELFGLEVEYRPYTEPISDEDLEVDAAIHAAAAQVCGYRPEDVAGHWEYARPLGRKPDRKPVGGPLLRSLVNSAAQRRTPTPLTEEDDDMAHVELIKMAYRRSRGADYDPSVHDPNGWSGWMLRLAGARTVDDRNGVVTMCNKAIDGEIARKGG